MNSTERTLLIFPPTTRPAEFSAKKVRVTPFLPLGLAYLSAALKREKLGEVRGVDALIEGDYTQGHDYPGQRIRYGLSDEEIVERIARFRPQVVGVSCLFSAMQWDAANVCRLAKQVDPNIVTLIGGAHASLNGRELLESFPHVDAAVIGEAEETLTQIVKDPARLGDCAGVVFRGPDGIQVNPKTQYIEDLDGIAFPDRQLFEVQRYLNLQGSHAGHKRSPFLQMISSRGCPNLCTFCALGPHWGSRTRKRSPENVLDEIEMLVNDFGVREIHFEDDNLTVNKRRALAIFRGMVERGIDVSWNCPSGMAVNTLDEELLLAMKASGCYSVSLAIESGNQDVLKRLMRKPVNLKKVGPLTRMIRNIGIEVRGFFILGFPGETKENMRETIDLARSLDLDWAYFFIFSPLPHTVVYRSCIEKGYLRKGQFDPMLSFHQPMVRTPDFSPEEVAEIREEAILDVCFENNANLRKYDPRRAIESFGQVARSYPNFDFAAFYLGEAYLKAGQPDEAVKSWRKTLQINPEHERARARLDEFGRVRKAG